LKSRFIRAIFIPIILILFTGFGFEGYRWWSAHQRRKALSLYLQKNSPVTRALPEDATIYLNLLGARRLLEQSQNTLFYRVFSHWLDTRMGEESKANPLLGGMLEKTLLNVIGQEVAIGLAPSRQNVWDIVTVARLAPGSDFLLKLALSQNKKLQRTEMGDQTIFTVETKDFRYPHLYVAIGSDFGYASNSMERIRNSLKSTGNGPSFLANMSWQTLPENTVLFFKSKDPAVTAEGIYEGKQLKIQVQSNLLLHGPLPSNPIAANDVLQMTTNISEIFHLPPALCTIRNLDGATTASTILGFENSERARSYSEQLRNQFESPSDENVGNDAYDCFRLPQKNNLELICRNQSLVLLTDARIDPLAILQSATIGAPRRNPLILDLRFQKEAVSGFADRVDRDDWADFSRSKCLYFLGCLKSIHGRVNGDNNEIVAEIN
jgi:hypothetical protein